MNFEIGTDIQYIKDFENLNNRFLKKVFTDDEIKYCLKKSKPAQHFAARFCAKEACIKALSQMKLNANYKDIEILIKDKKLLIKLNKEVNTKVSISHSNDYAVAFVIVMKYGK